MNKDVVKLGDMVEDVVTGFKGIAVAKVEYINGCIQFCIAPKSKDGIMGVSAYIDIQQLKIIEGGIEIKNTPTGGNMSNTPPTSYKG